MTRVTRRLLIQGRVQGVGFRWSLMEEARQRGLDGWVRNRNDGSVERIEIDRPSGHRVFDDAARRIVRLAEPFAEFPADIKRDYDVLEITRTWTFTSSNQLETK